MKQNSCKVIGITGGIASGKSTVTEVLIKEGFKIIDADKIARKVVEIGKPAYTEIVNTFGVEILESDLNINRRRLGQLVFNDSNLIDKLNKIIHPKIFEEIVHLIDNYCKSQRVIFIDVPLLIEELDNFKLYDVNIDEIWLVYIDREEQLKRLIKRDKYDCEEAIARINSQMSLEKKREYATVIIDNNNGIDELIIKVKKLIEPFK
ncbi:dephospho-CoA kinase [Anaerosalibacter sp. Marseille-P3206]|uniref:dephospho-CoA kinase n=1 Tax=Anaerosalibacter sp. Marseille-P3206 TaxID=1871005 RepID=UPI00098571DF|nr:dephospho-CoA kinase [Anaerosalibacter sp. Marseille-P3206]